MKTTTDAVVFGRSRIPYSIERTSRRKTIAITIQPNLVVSVAAPKGTRRSKIAAVVQSKSEWILARQDQLARNGKPLQRRFVSGESFLYLGRQYQLRIIRRPGRSIDPRVSLTKGYFYVTVPRWQSTERYQEIVRTVLIDWYRTHAAKQLEKIVLQFAARLRVDYADVRVREMKTRWGSGGSSGHLRFNWRIIMAPRRLVEYVAVHELCHIRHNDHSKRFWRQLARVMPNYERRRTELTMLGARLDI